MKSRQQLVCSNSLFSHLRESLDYSVQAPGPLYCKLFIQQRREKKVCLYFICVRSKDAWGWTVQTNVNRVPIEGGDSEGIASRTQMTCCASSTAKNKIKKIFNTIRDLVDRRGFNQVSKAVRLDTVGWWGVWGVTTGHPLLTLFLLFQSTSAVAQSGSTGNAREIQTVAGPD